MASTEHIMIYYITRKTAKIYQKLVETCKYFFAKNQIIVIECLVLTNKNRWEGCLNCDAKYLHFTNSSNKFWVTRSVITHYIATPLQISSIIPKLYRIDAKTLLLDNQSMTYKEYLFLSLNVEQIYLDHVIVNSENGGAVSMIKLIEGAPKANYFSYHSNNNENIFSEFFKIQYFPRIQNLAFRNIPEDSLNIEKFFAYIKAIKDVQFFLHFNNSISDAYKNRIEKVVDEILATENHDYKPPDIFFTGINPQKLRRLRGVIYVR